MSAMPRRTAIEGLESRTLLSLTITALGELTGRTAIRGTVGGQFEELIPGVDFIPTAPEAHFSGFSFHLSKAAQVQVQLSNYFAFPPNGFAPDIGMQLDNGTANDFDFGNFDVFDSSDAGPGQDELISESLAAGSYRILVSGDINRGTDFDLTVAADFADGATVSTSNTDIRADAANGEDLGTLAPLSNTTLTDFIGYSATSGDLAKDLVDTYFFDVPVAGVVGFNLDHLVQDPIGGRASATFTVYHDDNNNGSFQSSESITTRSAGAGQIVSIGPTLDPGHYAAVVTRPPLGGTTDTTLGGTNYRLRLSYAPIDTAGNTTTAARDIGVLDAPTQSFDEFLSSTDTLDFYKFTTVTGGPFVFTPKLTGVTNGASIVFDVIRGSDGVLMASGVQPDADPSIPLVVNGAYFVKVRRISGDGLYTLSMANRNLDLAGNSFADAKDLLRLDGRRHLADQVSAFDTDDFFKFRIGLGGTVLFNMDATQTGTDADLRLFTETGNQIGQSVHAGNVAESFSAVLPAATYFIDVRRAAGTPAYSLDLNFDTAGSFSGTARTLTTTGSANEFVGPGDTKDTFKTTLPSNLRLGAFFLFLRDPIDVAIGKDLNNNFVLDESEKIVNKTLEASPGSGVTVADNLNSGDYLIEVTSAGTIGTNYSISLGTNAFDTIGDTFKTAKNIGTLEAQQVFQEQVGEGTSNFIDDTGDMYHFTVGNAGRYSLNVQLTRLAAGADADLALFRDTNHNLKSDPGEQLVVSSTAGNADEILTNLIAIHGDYYLRVLQVSGASSYMVTLSAASTDTAGNDPAHARNLNTLTGVLSTANNFVGDVDHDDFFKFNVTSDCEASFLNTVNSGSPVMELIFDRNNNNAVDDGEVLVQSEQLGHGTTAFAGQFLATGTYFLHVQGNIQSTYSVLITRSPQTPFNSTFVIDHDNAAGTRIDAENFDRGDDGSEHNVAYHDSTDGNSGNQTGNNTFRADENIDVDVKTTADAGGGFRITDTDIGEFLEYTIFVKQAGLYDVDFRVSSPGSGGKFHAEVDGTNVTGVLDTPLTNSFDNMTTVTAHNVPLPFGPHIWRLEFDALVQNLDAANFAGSFNFMTIRPPDQTTGTFKFTSPNPYTSSGDSTLLGLEWTVPSGSWHTLDTVQLRLRDASGIGLLIKFDEAANTFSLFDPDTGRFTAGRTPGSNGHLSNRDVQINLRNSTVHAESPSSPTVQLTFDVTFKKFPPQLPARDFLVEAAASDDLGHDQDFEIAGRFVVLR